MALARTPELMAVLKEAGVVDAGGKGFVRMLEGVVRCIEGDPILPAPRPTDRRPKQYQSRPRWSTSPPSVTSSFCTEVLVRGEQLPAANEVRGAAPSVRWIARRRGGGRYPEDPCAHGYPGGRLYLCGPLGTRGDHQGRRHAGAAPEAGPSRAPPGRGRHRQLGRPVGCRARPASHLAGPAAGDLRRRRSSGTGSS